MAKAWSIPDLHPELDAAGAARAILDIRFRQMVEHREAVLLDEDIEDVHDMRVASRRLRAAWQAVEGVYPNAATRQFREEARQLTRMLGAVRDLDVIREDYANARRRAPQERRKGLSQVGRTLAAMRAYRFLKLSEALAVWRHEPFLEWLATASVRIKATELRLGDLAGVQIAPAVEGFLTRTGALTLPDAATAHHDLRIAGKKLRYVVEIFAPCVPDAEGVLDGLRDVQEALGVVQDRDMMGQFFAERLPVSHEPETAALAWLVADHRRRREIAYRRALTTWNRAVKTGFGVALQGLMKNSSLTVREG